MNVILGGFLLNGAFFLLGWLIIGLIGMICFLFYKKQYGTDIYTKKQEILMCISVLLISPIILSLIPFYIIYRIGRYVGEKL